MLRLDFINVGDGDSILVREDETNYVMLVDCGRPYIEFVKGSMRASAVNYLMKERVDHIDLMVLSHLHIDHIGGAYAILRRMPVKKMLAAYLPPDGARWVTAPAGSNVKTVVGLCDMLNMFSDIVSDVREKGGTCELAREGTIPVTNSLSMRVLLPDEGLLARQKSMFDGLYAGGQYPEDVLYAVSKERNCSSLRMYVDYAGRSALLTGDSYAAYWENDERAVPCDILKVPHHGDEKSMTERLLLRLKPEYAVVSCQNDTSTKKERPAERVLKLLSGHVRHVLCTENRPFPAFPATAHDAVRISIDSDGTIRCIPCG